MKGFSQIVYGLAALAAVAASPVEKRGPHIKYEGTQVIRVNLQSNKEVTRLKNIVGGLDLAVWSPKYRPGGTVDVVIPPAHQNAFKQAASVLNTEMLHDNLAETIAKEIQYNTYVAGSSPNSTWFNSYHSYADHLQWLNDVHAAYPDNTAIVTAPGKTVEGRDITGIKIWKKGNEAGRKKAAVFHGTVHAREWIATMVTEYFIYQLVQDGNEQYLENLEYHIFPVVNPDGFVYTQTTDRMWRKNRQAGPKGCSTPGTDINRNWPYQWGTGGSSTNCRAEDYRGESAGNTPENKALVAYQGTITQGTALYIDFHSYSQLLMSPWGYTCSKSLLPSNNAEVQGILMDWEAAIEATHGTEFEYGPICNTIYQASGSSADWMFATGKVPYALAVELRGNSFSLPANQIIPSGEEMWEGMKVLVERIKTD